MIPLGQPFPQRRTGTRVPRFGGADEVVIGEVHQRREFTKIARHAGGEFPRRHAGRRRRLLYLLTMLVGAGQEAHIIAVEPLETSDDVARKRRVHVTDMGHIVHVIDRRRDVVVRPCGHFYTVLLSMDGDIASQERAT